MQEAAPPNSLGMCKKVIGNVEMSTKLDMNIEQSSSRSSFSIQPIVVDNSSFPNKSWGRLSFFPGYFSIVIWRRIDPGEFCSFPFWIRPLLRAKEQMKPFVLRVHWFFCRCSKSFRSVEEEPSSLGRFRPQPRRLSFVGPLLRAAFVFRNPGKYLLLLLLLAAFPIDLQTQQRKRSLQLQTFETVRIASKRGEK